jgi:hypothetical protein
LYLKKWFQHHTEFFNGAFYVYFAIGLISSEMKIYAQILSKSGYETGSEESCYDHNKENSTVKIKNGKMTTEKQSVKFN